MFPTGRLITASSDQPPMGVTGRLLNSRGKCATFTHSGQEQKDQKKEKENHWVMTLV